MLHSVISNAVKTLSATSNVGKSSLTDFRCATRPFTNLLCETRPFADFLCRTRLSLIAPRLYRPLDNGEDSTLASLQRRTHRRLLSAPLAGRSPELRILDPQASTLTPQKLPCSRPLPVATSLVHRGGMLCSEVGLPPTPAGPPLPLGHWCG